MGLRCLPCVWQTLLESQYFGQSPGHCQGLSEPERACQHCREGPRQTQVRMKWWEPECGLSTAHPTVLPAVAALTRKLCFMSRDPAASARYVEAGNKAHTLWPLCAWRCHPQAAASAAHMGPGAGWGSPRHTSRKPGCDSQSQQPVPAVLKDSSRLPGDSWLGVTWRPPLAPCAVWHRCSFLLVNPTSTHEGQETERPGARASGGMWPAAGVTASGGACWP